MTTEEDLTTNPLGKWDTELEGIWVAKYEASRETSADGENWNASAGSNTLTTNAGNTSSTKSRVAVKPSMTSWRSISQSNIYINCENMYPTLNTHKMKNSEWGSSWCYDDSHFSEGNKAFFLRGDYFISESDSGVFSFSYDSGRYMFNNDGFRPVICVTP